MIILRHWYWLTICCAFSLAASTDYNEFIADKTYQQGFYSFYQDKKEGKVFLEISQFEQPFIFQSSLPHGIGSNDIGLDRGQLGDTRLVQFERVGKKVFLRQLNTYYRADSDNPLEQQAINEAFASSIIWGFSVVSEDSASSKVYVDYTPFLLSDIHNIGETLNKKKQGSYSVDTNRSALYPKRIKAFPQNTEFEAVVTFKGSNAGKHLKSVTPERKSVTVNLHHSLIQLPDEGYQPRKFHPFSGFWQHSYADYASAIDEPIIKRFIPRHRLHKKHPEKAISEAIKPIVYYLDAGVPEPIRSALLDGARWWSEAFEAAGFKEAFHVKMLPEDADPMDVRYNVIQWVHRATRGWSYGSSVIDPRTGEIIKGHVTLGSLRVRQDYLIALGLTSPFKYEQTDTSAMKNMALARIRQLSAHEIGHTLGIAHNFAASANDRASVMDYPHPYVFLKNNKISLVDAYGSGIGQWDKHVIAYGYADVESERETAYLEETVAKAKSAGLMYMSDPDARPQSGAHHTGHLWDNGQDPAQELLRVLAVRKHALKNMGSNSIPHGVPFAELEQVLVPIYNFHRFQVEAAVKLIGGVNYQYAIKGEDEGKLTIMNADSQRQALDALIKTLSTETLTMPAHIVALIPPKAYGYGRDRESFTGKTGLTFDPISAADASAKHTLRLLLNSERLTRLAQQSALNDDIISVADMLAKLVDSTIKQSVKQAHARLVQQRVNQQLLHHLLKLWHNKNTAIEIRAEVYAILTELNTWLRTQKDKKRYRALRAHFALLAVQIEYGLTHEKQMLPQADINLPPGSPIGS